MSHDVFFDVFRSYRVFANYNNIFHFTFHHRVRERRSMKKKIQNQQYFISWKKNVFIKYLLQMFDFEQLIQIKFIFVLIFKIICHRLIIDKFFKFFDRNWTKILKKRHSKFITRKIKTLNWNRHEKNIYEKITHWFEMIKDVLQNSTVLIENEYNMNEIEIMFFISNFVKILVNKHDMRNYKNARIKRTIVIAIECINNDNKYLNFMIIWSANIHRNN